jgi:hypothetical protein
MYRTLLSNCPPEYGQDARPSSTTGLPRCGSSDGIRLAPAYSPPPLPWVNAIATAARPLAPRPPPPQPPGYSWLHPAPGRRHRPIIPSPRPPRRIHSPQPASLLRLGRKLRTRRRGSSIGSKPKRRQPCTHRRLCGLWHAFNRWDPIHRLLGRCQIQ